MTASPASDLAKRPRPLRECGICRTPFGKDRPKTKDHVAPDGFFGQPKPANLPTWQVCGPCQGDLSPREERLRSLFARAHSHHPDEVTHVRDSASRSTRKPTPIVRKLVESPAGLQVPANIATPDQDDLDRAFTKISTGLFWWRTGNLPTSSAFQVRLMNSEAFDQWSRIVSQPVQRLGSEFWWMTGLDEGNLTWGIWLFVIFGAVPIGVWHGCAAELQHLPDPAGVALREDGSLG